MLTDKLYTNSKKHNNKIHNCKNIIGGRLDKIPLMVNLGFIGIQIHLLHKKPKRGKLTIIYKK